VSSGTRHQGILSIMRVLSAVVRRSAALRARLRQIGLVSCFRHPGTCLSGLPQDDRCNRRGEGRQSKNKRLNAREPWVVRDWIPTNLIVFVVRYSRLQNNQRATV
jgi:hypothetical protein